MRGSLPAVLAIVLLGAAPLSADDRALPLDNDAACMQGPLAGFGRYIGRWRIEDQRLGNDGSTWLAGDGAHWHFVCVGDGTAIQDFWIPNDGPVGTNLRTYNPETGSWDIAWAVRTQPGFAHIQAEPQDDGTIVMHYKSPLPDPLRRITFYPPTGAGWNWKLEFSRDDGETWTEVYRIRATPLP